MTTTEMRIALKNKTKYCGNAWVDKLTDKQVYCVYTNLKKKGEIK